MNPKLTYGKNQIAWRRAQVLELAAKGLTYMEIASTLQISHRTVGNDLEFIKVEAQGIYIIISKKQSLLNIGEQ